MIVATNRDNRQEWTREQIDFFMKLLPFAVKTQEWTANKAEFMGVPSPGIHVCITLADLILTSEWGTHPLSKPTYIGRYSNNLGLVEQGKWWGGKTHLFQDKRYRAYKDWNDFILDLTDEYTFTRQYDNVLEALSIEGQLQELEEARGVSLQSRIDFIDKYALREFI